MNVGMVGRGRAAKPYGFPVAESGPDGFHYMMGMDLERSKEEMDP